MSNRALVSLVAVVCVAVIALLSFDSGTLSIKNPQTFSRATVLFAGDMMFDRSVRRVTQEKGGDFIFSCIDETLQDADFVVANLEGPITANDSVSINSQPEDQFNYTFTFPTSTAELLLAHRISVVNLGNNHIENFGKEGVESTMDALRKAGVSYFGDPLGRTVAEGESNGIRFSFISYNEFGGSASTTISQIYSEREKGFLPIVYTHWGMEYATTSSLVTQHLAHQFIDVGAEIVIGSHPHVVQESEIYKGKYIYYSLGNFIFDQYFEENVTRGLLLKVDFDLRGMRSVKEIPIELHRDRRTCPVR